MRFTSNTRVTCRCPDRTVETVRAVAHTDGHANAMRHGPGTQCGFEPWDGVDYLVFQGTEAEAHAWAMRVTDEHAPEWRRGTN